MPLLPSRRLVLAYGALVLAHLLGLIFPFLIKLVLDEALALGRRDLLGQYAAIGLTLVAGSSAASFAGRFWLARESEQIWYELRKAVFGRLLTMSIEQHHARSHGERMTLIANDTDLVRNYHQALLPLILQLLVTVGGTAVILFALAPRLALIAAIPVPVVLILGRLLQRHIRALSRRELEERGDFYGAVDEGLRGLSDIRLFGAEDYFERRVDTHSRALRDAGRSLAYRYAVMGPVMGFFVSLSLLAILVYGGLQVLAGAATLGTLVVFYYYIARAVRPLQSAVNLPLTWHRIAAARQRLDALLSDERRLVYGTAELPPEPLGLEVDTISYAYQSPDRTVEATRSLSLSIGAGEAIAVLGPSGAGKTTLGRLLVRLVDPMEGQIRLGDRPLPELREDALRDAVGYVGQDVFLFDATIRENIDFGRGLEPELIEAAARAAAVDEFADQRDGLDTRIGEQGVRLSGGQRKRIALARALVGHPRVLVLDQLATDLEEALNARIFSRLRDIADLTIVYLGHRVPPALHPDEVYWLERGAIVRREPARPEYVV